MQSTRKGRWRQLTPDPFTPAPSINHFGVGDNVGNGQNHQQAAVAGDDEAALRRLSESLQSIRVELAKIIVGQEDVIEQLLIALLAGGHCLLVGVPGLAKTVTAR